VLGNAREVHAGRLDGSTVIVTAGGRGLGQAIALRFAQEGARRIALIDVSPDNLASAVAQLEAIGVEALSIEADLSRGDECMRSMQAVVAAFGAPDVVISNAGVSSGAPFLNLELNAWQRVIDVNLTASFVVGQEAARAMISKGVRGSILYTASVAGHGGVPGAIDYSVSKAGIVTLVRSMALELAPHGIRVLSISPGWMDTPGTAEIEGAAAMERYRRGGFPFAPLGRMAYPDEVAGLFAFLASSEAAYMTGVDVTIDGGMTAPAFPLPDSLQES
jgi:NAD(P)-dependent dehydrogenase (short-subunit alcohol dehydrogenase family)